MNGRPDKHLVALRFGRALHSYRQHAVIQKRMALRLAEMVVRAGIPPAVDRVLETGCGTGILTSALLDRITVGSYFANDLVAGSRELVAEVVRGLNVGEFTFLQGDIETLEPLPDNLDLVVSNATLQWLHDHGAFFDRMARVIRPGGVLAFSTFSTGTMLEIARLESVSLAYLPSEELVRLASGAFDAIALSEEEHRLEFPSPEAVLQHIRQTGVNGLSERTWSRTYLRRFLHRYRSSFGLGDGVSLTYRPLYCCFRRKEL